MLSQPADLIRSVRDDILDGSPCLDWLEATSLLMAEEISQSDVVDYLLEEQILEEQDAASNFVLNVWTELLARLSCMGPYAPVVFEDRWMIRQEKWEHVPAYSFCLVVSLGPKYHGWREKFGFDYTEQGKLFELITKDAMSTLFDGWEFLETGWSRDNSSKLVDVIDELIEAIRERRGNVEGYLDENAKDAGVDLIWHRQFADSRGGAPVFLTQCASGKDWTDKVNQPNLQEWMKFIDFAAPPHKAFSLPYALSDRELRRQSNRAGGLVVDRYRLLTQNEPESAWVSDSLRDRLNEWLAPRIDWITSR